MKHPHGFTLVELLIVVAIIGVLSTIGVPTYRRMVQKSKQAEAKTILGSIYNVEAAFFAEWNTYGNNLAFMGLEVEGPPPNVVTFGWGNCPQNYSVGFPIPVPLDPFCMPSPQEPNSTSARGSILVKQIPEYWKTQKGAMLFARKEASVIAYCENSQFTFAADGSVTSYLSTATGVISPNVPLDGLQREDNDIWTINELRELTHVHDGVK